MYLKLKQIGMTYAEIAGLFQVHRTSVQQLIAVRHQSLVGQCAKCGRQSNSLHRHHVSYVPEVIETICISCHRKEHVHIEPKSTPV